MTLATSDTCGKTRKKRTDPTRLKNKLLFLVQKVLSTGLGGNVWTQLCAWLYRYLAWSLKWEEGFISLKALAP